MALNFDKYAQEGNAFVNNLADKLGHPRETGRTGILLRAVLHTLRDRITVEESLNMISQFPAFIKAIYAENWKAREKPLQIRTVGEFCEQVKEHQSMYGEQEFDWNKSTEELVGIVLESLSDYVTEGEAGNVIAQLPEEMKEYFREKLIA